MMTHRRVLAALGGLLLLDCASPQKAHPEPEIISLPAQVAEQDLATITLKAPLTIHNAAPTPLTVPSARWEVIIDGQETVSGVHRFDDWTIEPGQESRSAIVATVPLQGANASLRQSGSKDVLHFSMESHIEIGSSSGAETYVAEWSGEFLAPEQVALSLTPQAARTPSSVEINFVLGVQNTNSFPLRVRSIDYSLLIEGNEVMHGRATGRELAPGSMLQFDLHKLLSGEEHAAFVSSIAGKPGFDYALKAQVEAGGQMHQQDIEGRVDFP